MLSTDLLTLDLFKARAVLTVQLDHKDLPVLQDQVDQVAQVVVLVQQVLQVLKVI